MNKAVYCAVIAAFTVSAPAFAGSGHGETKVHAEKNVLVPASARLNQVTFDLRPGAPSNVKPVVAENETVFATSQEVKIEDYSFNLK